MAVSEQRLGLKQDVQLILMEVNVHHSKTQLSKLIPQPRAGKRSSSPATASPLVDPPSLRNYPNPMKVSAQYAEEHLTDILNAADSGEEVEIARPDQTTYRLTLVKSAPIKPKWPRILGAGRGG